MSCATRDARHLQEDGAATDTPATGNAPAAQLAQPVVISPVVPHDVPAGKSATIEQLAIFAWQEFIALNWPSVDPAVTGTRGRADDSQRFLEIAPDSSGSYPLLDWQTYRHKNELFPASGATDPTFDSKAPTYDYKGGPFTPANGASWQLFNNLDESSEIGLCNMFAHDTTRILYEAKVNRAIFDYANANKLTACDNKDNCPTLTAARTKTMGNLADFGGICSNDPSIVSLPCGDARTPGDPGEGAIEIKAAWRQLTAAEAASGRFYATKVIYYTGDQFSPQQYNNAIYGLVALHIIHKTRSFPTFVFASWEQIDNYDDVNQTNPQHLAFVNTGTNLPNIPVARAHAIHSAIPPINDAVHAEFTAQAPNTVWQYYKLIGVQAMPMTGPPPAKAPADTLSYYYLANLVVETNQTLQNFFGAAPNGVVEPFQNVYLKDAAGSPFQMGGCQGCHGTQGQALGGDMSRLLGAAPANSTQPPEPISSSTEAARRSFSSRSRDARPLALDTTRRPSTPPRQTEPPKAIEAFTTFAQVQAALENFVTKNNIPVSQAPHGNMWMRGNSPTEQYKAFVTGVAIPGFPILIPGNGDKSNIILALRGQAPFDGSTFPQMPVGGPYLDEPTIAAISAWITAGAKQ